MVNILIINRLFRGQGYAIMIEESPSSADFRLFKQ
jgi:hypothetical protein